jgi:hypothetical protein
MANMTVGTGPRFLIQGLVARAVLPVLVLGNHSGDTTEPEGLPERRTKTASREPQEAVVSLSYFLLGSSSGLTYLTPHGPTP